MHTTQEFKISIATLLPEVDDYSVLETCLGLMERYLTLKRVRLHQEKVVGYTLNGEKLTIEHLESALNEAMARLKSGQGVSQKELEQMALSW